MGNKTVTHLQPGNIRAWLGLGDAFRAVSRTQDAESAYRRVTELDPHGQGGELAREGLSHLAHSSFRGSNPRGPRPDAVEYCLV
jgi:hypothetical protein